VTTHCRPHSAMNGQRRNRFSRSCLLFFLLLDNDSPLDVIAKVLGHDNLDLTAHCKQHTRPLVKQPKTAATPR
jgi:hypothetical protein